MNRRDMCDACKLQANGVTSRIKMIHTCGGTDEKKISSGLKNIKKMQNKYKRK